MRRGAMIITSGKVIMCTGLAALALVACGGESSTSVDGKTSTGAGIAGSGGVGGADGTGGTGGGGGGGGQGGAVEIPVAEVVDCEGIIPVASVTGEYVPGPPPDYIYVPSEITLKVGEAVYFEPFEAIRNIESGVFPAQDGRFATPLDQIACLRFNVAGKYPFFAMWFWSYKANGHVLVE
jgi:hypothetical protein